MISAESPLGKENTAAAEDGSSQALADSIYYYLRDEISSLQLEPGEKLSELKISKQFNCSRIPVREAVKRLATEGALDIYPKRGCFVSAIHLNKMAQIRYIREVIETRVVLDDYDKGLLQPLIPILRSMIDRQRKSILQNDYRNVFLLDNEFHFLFFSVDHKDFAYEYAGMNEINYYRARLLTLKEEPKTDMINQHTAIVDAIEKNDREALCTALAQHFSNVTDKLMKSTDLRTKKGAAYFTGTADPTSSGS